MRGTAYALLAFGALALGAMIPSPAAAGCYGDDCGYRERAPVTYYESAPRTYERYAERPYYRDHAPTYRAHYHDRSAYSYRSSCYERSNCYDRPVVRTTYVDGGYYRPSYRSYYRPYYRKHYSSYPYYHRPHYHTVRYGGGWTQTGYGYHGGYAYGGCHTAYIPYGWTWYRARSC
ncbi:MAG: hypothetical protein FJX62_07565 [Alphaproteobacteria bacterium]|nr:hypothetical protein [Alphaproteobacteria bacterium]